MYDPTRTTTLRENYRKDFYNRFEWLKGQVNQYFKEDDVLQIKQAAGSSVEKQREFQGWLQDRIDEGLLEPVSETYLVKGAHWTSPYVKEASRRGLDRAQKELAKGEYEPEGGWQEAAFALGSAPVHKDLLESIYRRQFTNLEGITGDIESQLQRILSDGLARGAGAYEIASDINDQIDTIYSTRAKTMARTEVVRAYNQHALTEYERQGVRQVSFVVEWITAGDHRVCAQCRGLSGQVMNIDQAKGLLPLHPNCRCTVIPVV